MFDEFYFEFDAQKNALLQQERDISFEQIIVLMETGNIASVKPHHNQKKYPNQYIVEVVSDDYIYLVPFVIEKSKIFLKTIYPSRKATKNYTKGKKDA
mgnify:CR=1 FL=1